MNIDTNKLIYVGFGTVFAGYVSHNDRGTNQQCVGLFDTEHNAKISVAGKSYYGANGTVRAETVIIFTDVDNKKYAYQIGTVCEVKQTSLVDEERELKRQKEHALSKLTAAERVLLGLT